MHRKGRGCMESDTCTCTCGCKMKEMAAKYKFVLIAFVIGYLLGVLARKVVVVNCNGSNNNMIIGDDNKLKEGKKK